MNSSARSHVASSFTLIKGAMIDETYAVFAAWDFALPSAKTLIASVEKISSARARPLGFAMLHKVLNRRFDPNGRDRALVVLAKERLPDRRMEADSALAHHARRILCFEISSQLAFPDLCVRGVSRSA